MHPMQVEKLENAIRPSARHNDHAPVPVSALPVEACAAMDNDVKAILEEVEMTQMQLLGVIPDQPEKAPALKDAVFFVLDIISQLEDPAAQRDALQVLRRVLVPSLAFLNDRKVLTAPIGSGLNAAPASLLLSPRRMNKGNSVLKALLTTLNALGSRQDVATDLLSDLVDLIQRNCLHSMHSADVAMLFDCLRVGQPPARRMLLQMMQTLMELETIPREVFSMQGQHGGIIAPSAQMLFSKKGYSVSMGLHLDANPTTVALYSFRGSNGQGISAVMEAATLVAKMHGPQGSVQQLKILFGEWRTRMEQHWVHLCIVHAKKMVFKDKLTVYVDGKPIYTGNLAYPDPLCMVGGHNCIGIIPALPSLQGKIWSPTLFGQALADAEVSKLHWLTHWKSDLSSVAAENTGLTDKSKFIFSYDARSCDMDKRICYDVSGSDCHGWLEPGTTAYVTQGFRQALDSIGGCACFLLLLLDQIPEMADFHPKHEFIREEISDLVTFVGVGLQNSLACRSHFVRLQGVKVLAFVLQSISPSYLTVELLGGVTLVLESILEFVDLDQIEDTVQLLLFSNTSWFLSPFDAQVKLLGDVLPRYLQVLQETRHKKNQAANSSASGLGITAPAATSTDLDLLDPKPDVDVNFFCNLLVEVYSPKPTAPADENSDTPGKMDTKQLQTLRKLVIENLIDRLLFPSFADPSLDQWRQLLAHICLRSFSTLDADTESSTDASSCVEVHEILRYLTQILGIEAHATSSQVPARQLMTGKLCKITKGTLRFWWRPLFSSNAGIRIEALRAFEAYTLDKVLLRRKDIYMLYTSQQPHTLSMTTADLLLDIIIGRKHAGHFAAGSGAPVTTGSPSGGVRSLNVSRIEFMPLVLMGLLQQADAHVQLHVLLEIKTQLANPTTGDNVKEAIRSWPPWLTRLRALAQHGSVNSIGAEEINDELDLQTLNNLCGLLSDDRASAGSKIDAVQSISKARDARGCDFMVSLFQDAAQPPSVWKAIALAVRDHFPSRANVLVSKMASQMIVDVVVYSVLHVRNGWMHCLEFYFHHFRQPTDLCNMAALISDRCLSGAAKAASGGDHDFVWENLCQVAAIFSHSELLSKSSGIDTALLSKNQKRILLRKAFELWLVVLPRLQLINWEDARTQLLQHTDYGSDVAMEEKAIYCSLVAGHSLARLSALRTSLRYVALVQEASESTPELMAGFRKTLELLRVIAPASSVAPQDPSKAGQAMSSVVSPRLSVTPLSPTGIGSSYADAVAFLGTNTGVAGPIDRGLVHLYILDACFAILGQEIAMGRSFDAAFTVVSTMVAVASASLQLLSLDSRLEVLKTVQIMSSTELLFFRERSQLDELFMLWNLHRTNHSSCCDVSVMDAQIALQEEPLVRRWTQLIQHSPVEFNPFLTNYFATQHAEVLSQEVQASEELWKEIVDENATALAAQRENAPDEEVRLTSLKREAEKFASGVHKLIAQTSLERATMALDEIVGPQEPSDGPSPMAETNTGDGYLSKIDSRESSSRMRLRLKRVRENYRLRNLSIEYTAGSSFHDTESRGSGHHLRRFRSREAGIDMDKSWISDAGSDYSDFLADAQMRAAIIRSCSVIGGEEFDRHSDEDDIDDDELPDDPPEEDNVAVGASLNASELVQSDVGEPDSASTINESDSSNQEGGVTAVSEPVDVVPPTLPPSAASAKSSSPSSPSSLGGFSFGASMLSVVGMVQKAAKDAKDAMDYSVDSLYTAKDAISEEAQSLISEVSTIIETSKVIGSPKASGTPPASASPPLSKVSSDVKSGEAPVLFPSNPQRRQSRRSSSLDSDPGNAKTSPSRPTPTPPSSTASSNPRRDLTVDAKLVRHMHVVDGKLIVAGSSVHFVAERVIDEHDSVLVAKKKGIPVAKAWRFLFKRRRWKVDDVATIHRRRYLLKPTAIEIFIHSSRKNYFFNLSANDIGPFHEALMARRPLLLKRDPAMRRLRHPSSIFRTSSMSIKWINHEISTFEYLMWLNTIAGRTYNDLTQYPVFPWVIADYESSTLDLSRAETFRDLTKPIGALEPSRLKFFLDRYNAFEDNDIPKFMYGTHYSNIGVVLYFLIRLEPFTSYSLSVQGGKFDHADRLFHSVAETWRNCLNDFTDLKELTPEWFYLPEFLVNCNKLDLGTKQNGVELGDVILPPWAKSPEDFVMKNLVALESDYVSANIHHWIDLVFGWKQRGPAAVAANNVFFYLTYEGMVDVDSITDPVIKSSMRAQIAHFGQTPSQLLRDPHPPRHQLPKAALTTVSAQPTDALTVSRPHSCAGTVLNVPHEHPLVFLQLVAGTSMIACLDGHGMFSAHRFGTKSSKVHQNPFLTDLSASATKASGVFKAAAANVSSANPTTGATNASTGNAGSTGTVAVDPWADYIELQDRKSRKLISEKKFTASNDALAAQLAFINGGAIYCTVGHHDFSARFHSTSDGTLLYRLLQHQSVVTCLGTSQLGSVLAMGCADGTLSVWKVTHINVTLLDAIKIFRGSKSNSKPVHANDYAADQVLLGHNARVNCVAISEDLGVCVSGSASNECMAHNLNDGAILRQYELPGSLAPGVVSLALSSVGHLLVQSLGMGVPALYSFHLNGKLLATHTLGDQPMHSLSVSARYSKVIVSNSSQALMLCAHTLLDQVTLWTRDQLGDIHTQALSPDETHVVLAVGQGKIVSVPLHTAIPRVAPATPSMQSRLSTPLEPVPELPSSTLPTPVPPVPPESQSVGS
ncbi:TPA: hypothetical protein N0F65_003480 [Lagenidium giganteum]|uniref:Uncharacterized protein n=1 Tax=Lagenidium giganteum TaxID=4803 RepID=A0AAV2YEK1_9STRA|nr:TPA: hypothetical protein N0F65_003480 [Lagenidium giganteum]